jgi:hypothetical protein
MPTVETYVEVEVELDEFSDDDLKEELERRGLGAEVPELIERIYLKRRVGKDYQTELEQLIYQTIGKIV